VEVIEMKVIESMINSTTTQIIIDYGNDYRREYIITNHPRLNYQQIADFVSLQTGKRTL
jgi:hypothetical protein